MIYELKGVTKTYKNNKILDIKELQIVDGEFLMIIAKSGFGKTTLLKILGGLIKPTKGALYFRGDEVKKQYDIRKQVGFVLQDFCLIEHITVNKNLKLICSNDDEIKEILDKLGILKLLNQKVKNLSGGEKQRVAIARSLLSGHDVILADEPTGNLDTETTYEIMELFKELNDNGMTIVMVTHDLTLLKYATNVLKLD
ncbi:ATP-binding cassette domain-containing protein [Mollicutes bacterium LVI A0039]|nr:ATP-binding cassette domain-containing protein [Mollicutes bacterium LVI A0039]